MTSRERAVLSIEVLPHHGSTALESVLMSSERVATLCRGGGWQCEARFVLCEDKTGKHCPVDGGDLTEFGGRFETFKRALATLSDYWNTSRQVFVLKHSNFLTRYPLRLPYLGRNDLPAQLLDKGVHRLHFAWVMMWNPPCLTNMSAHKLPARADIHMLKILVGRLKWMDMHGYPVLVLLRGDVLWRWQCVESCLSNFMPCLGQLNIDFVPRLNVDVFASNQMKITQSTKMFAERHLPESSGYDVEAGECVNLTQRYGMLEEMEESLRFMMFRSCRCGAMPEFRFRRQWS